MHNVHVPNQYNSGVQAQIGHGGVPTQTQCLISPLDGQQQKQAPCKATTALRQWRKQHSNPMTIAQQQQQQQQELRKSASSGAMSCQLMPQGGGGVASVARVAPQMHYHHHHPQQQQPPPYAGSYHHVPQHHQAAPPPVRYSEIVEVPSPGPQVKQAAPKDVEMMLGHHWGAWGQHHAPSGHEHLGYHSVSTSYPPHRAYSSASQGVGGTAARPPPTQPPFSAETNQYLAKLQKINPRVAQSIINDSFLDQSRLFNTHHVYPPPMYPSHSKSAAYPPQSPYSPSGGYYVQKAPQPQQPSPTAYKYNAHLEQPPRNISPTKHRPPPYMDQNYAPASSKQPYLEYSQHYQHRTNAVAPAAPSANRHFPASGFYHSRSHPGALQGSDDFQYGHPRRMDNPAGDGAKSDGGNINLKTFLESWNEEDVANEGVKGAKGTELYVYDSTDISNEALGQYLHIQQVDKLPENIRGYFAPPEEGTPPSAATPSEGSNVASPKTVIKENVFVSSPAPTAAKTEEAADNSTKNGDVDAKVADEVVEKPAEEAEVKEDVETAAAAATNIPKKEHDTELKPTKDVVEDEETEDSAKEKPEPLQAAPVKVEDDAEKLIPKETEAKAPEPEPETETDVREESPIPDILEDVKTAEENLQIEKVQINNREVLKINQNNVMLQIGDDMCLEIDVNSDGEKVITVKTCQGSWQLSELSNENKSALASPETPQATQENLMETSDCTEELNNLQDWVCEEEVVSQTTEEISEMIQENKIESSEKNGFDAKKRLQMKRYAKNKRSLMLKRRKMKKWGKLKMLRLQKGHVETLRNAQENPEEDVVFEETEKEGTEPEVLNNNDEKVNHNMENVPEDTKKEDLEDELDKKLAGLPSVYLLRLDEIIKLNAVDLMIGKKLKEIEEIELKSLKCHNVCCKKKQEHEEEETCEKQTERENGTDKVQKKEEDEDKLNLSKNEVAIYKRRLSLEEYNYRKRLDQQKRQALEVCSLTNDLLDVKSIPSRKLPSPEAEKPPPETIPLSLPVIPVRSKEEILRCNNNLRQLRETKDIVRRFLNKECLSRSELLKVQEIIKFKSLLTKKEDGEPEASDAGVAPPNFKLQLTLKKRKRRRFRNLYSEEDEAPVEDKDGGDTQACIRDPRLLYGKRSVPPPVEDQQKMEVPTIIIKKNGSAYSSSVKP